LNKTDPSLIKLEIKRTAHVYESGLKSAAIGWMMTHGYGMQANKLLGKFRVLDQNQHYFLSPEGLSKFYWKGVHHDEVVASWMTKRHRLDEIEDYTNYLEQVYDKLRDRKRKVLFGFSQGGTTMWRFIHAKKPDFDVFINWAGNIPQDIEIEKMQAYLSNKKLIYVAGDKDEFITKERYEGLQKLSRLKGLNIEFIQTEGDHRVNKEVLISLTEKLF